MTDDVKIEGAQHDDEIIDTELSDEALDRYVGEVRISVMNCSLRRPE